MSTAALLLPTWRNRMAMLVRDYAELTKMRVTTLIVMTAWCGFYFGALKSGISSLSWDLFHGLLGARSPIALSTTLPISRVSYPPSPSSSSRKFLLTIMSRSLLKPGSAS